MKRSFEDVECSNVLSPSFVIQGNLGERSNNLITGVLNAD